MGDLLILVKKNLKWILISKLVIEHIYTTRGERVISVR